MQIAKILSAAALLSFHTSVYGQFNTFKKNKVLPKVQVDSATAKTRSLSMATSLPVIDSTRFKITKRHAGAMVSLPLSSPIINSGYGIRIDPITGKAKFHYGIDFKGSSDLVMVIMPGEVKKVGYSRGLGSYIEVEHGDFKTTYGHLSLIMVREKTKLKAGTAIGLTGTTGRSTGDHLHFEIKHKGRIIDPIPFLDLIYQSLEPNSYPYSGRGRLVH